MHQIDATIAVAALAVAVLGMASARLQTLPLSRPLLALALGIAAGPAVLGWLRPAEWGDEHLILKEAARFTLAISVVGVALRIRTRELARIARPVTVLLTVAMLAMWAVSSGLAWAVLGVTPALAMLLGAVVTPTDPVVASAIVTGRTARCTLPATTRDALSAESGANDGLAYLIVMAPLLALTTSGSWGGRWTVEVLLVGIGLAIVAGAAVGGLAGIALRAADRRGWVAESSILGFSIALSLLAVTGARLAGSDGILAAFVAGLAFNAFIDHKEEEDEENVQEAISKLFNLPVFVIFGAALPWAAWAELGASGAVFAAALLVLRRPLAVLASRALLGGGLLRRDLLFLGWFGPVGVAAIYYALHATERIGDDRVWAATSLAVVASLLAHGLTSGPGLKLYARAAGKPEAASGVAETGAGREE